MSVIVFFSLNFVTLWMYFVCIANFFSFFFSPFNFWVVNFGRIVQKYANSKGRKKKYRRVVWFVKVSVCAKNEKKFGTNTCESFEYFSFLLAFFAWCVVLYFAQEKRNNEFECIAIENTYTGRVKFCSWIFRLFLFLSLYSLFFSVRCELEVCVFLREFQIMHLKHTQNKFDEHSFYFLLFRSIDKHRTMWIMHKILRFFLFFALKCLTSTMEARKNWLSNFFFHEILTLLRATKRINTWTKETTIGHTQIDCVILYCYMDFRWDVSRAQCVREKARVTAVSLSCIHQSFAEAVRWYVCVMPLQRLYSVWERERERL